MAKASRLQDLRAVLDARKTEAGGTPAPQGTCAASSRERESLASTVRVRQRHSRPVVAGVLAIAAVAAVVGYSSSQGRRQWSATLDETFYFANAIDATFERRIPAMLTTSGVAPLPILISYLIPALRAGDLGRPSPWIGIPTDVVFIDEARLVHAALVAFPLCLTTMIWLWRRNGLMCATVGGLLIALSPTVAAHGSLATTDCSVALGSLLTLAALAVHWQSRTWGSLALAAFAFAAAMACKYSAAFLAPLVLVSSAMACPIAATLRLRWGRVAGFVALAFVATWGLHGFQIAQTSTGPAPEFVLGLLEQFKHQREGHDAFLMGEKSKTGWWYFFPLAFWFKSTPVELLLSAVFLYRVVVHVYFAGNTLWCKRLAFTTPHECRRDHQVRSDISMAGSWTRGDPTGRALDHAANLWFAAAGLYWLAAIASKVQIGQRFLLPFYPLLILVAVDGLWRLCRNAGKSRTALSWLARTIGVLLVVGQGTSHWSIGPHYLSYFNSLCGGPENGYRLLADSSIDWGQDLPALRDQLDKRGTRLVLLRYFGTALPVSYGIDAVRINVRVGSEEARCRFVAISVTELQGVYLPTDPFADFRKLAPDGRAAYSILLFDRQQPEVQAAATRAIQIFRADNRTPATQRSIDDYLQ